MDKSYDSSKAGATSVKIVRLNNFCAIVFVLVFIVLLAFNSKSWYAEKFSQIKGSIESHFAVFPYGKIDTGLKRVFVLYTWLTNRKITNDVVVMNDGRLIIKQSEDSALLEEKADDIVLLKDYLIKNSTPFLFVRVPDKMQDISQLPFGYTNSIIEDGERFVAMLKESDVDTLDLRKEMMSENIDFATAFYRGDHHWTAQTALWAFGKIGSVMNTNYDFNLDEKIWNLQEYDSITYEKAFMGSESGRIGDPRLKEDITALIPKFSTEFEATNLNTDGKAEVVSKGNFTEVFVPKAKNERNNSFSQYDLNAVDMRFSQYKNLMTNERKKVLLISDSFGRVMSTYLACSLEYVYYLYLSEDNNKKLYHTLEKENFDLVIFLVFDQVICSNNDDFGKDRMHLGEPPT